jgi:hypothetical protein
MVLSFIYKEVKRGMLYRVRYRSRNIIGWSDYSPIAYLLASSAPSSPPAPRYIAATSQTISI